MDQEKREAVVIRELEASDVGLADVIDETLRRMREKSNNLEASNFNPAVDEDVVAQMTAECAKAHVIFNECPVTIDCVYLSVREAEEMNRKSGEIESKNRSTFVDTLGEVWATNSPVVYRVVDRILSSRYGKKRFDPPLKISFEKTPTGSGGHCLVATVDMSNIRKMLSTVES